MTDIEQRRRRAVYRAMHRGTKEMDWLLGRFVAAKAEAMADPELERLEALIGLQDPELQGWIMTGTPEGPPELADMVEDLRRFHGLGDTPARGAAGS